MIAHHLDGRTAICSGCAAHVVSSTSLREFRHVPENAFDEFDCGCRDVSNAELIASRGYREVPCVSCRAPMWWAVSPTGAAMPMDRDPAADGKFLASSIVGHSIQLANAPTDYAGPRYHTHFSTCPNASTHRRPKKVRR